MEERKLQPSSSTGNPTVAVVILNWNGRAFLERFLPLLIERSMYESLQIIVADNASSDDSVSFLRRHFPSIGLIENKENLGFAAGYNEALKQVNTDYLILLNSDVEVAPNWIAPVIAEMESDSNIAAAQPLLKDFNDRQRYEYAGAAGGYLDMFGYPFCRGRIFESIEDDHGQYQNTADVLWASGAALFIKRQAWLEVGGFDADFFAHMEEIDLCWRLRNKGYRVICCPQAVVYHIGGGTLQSDSPFKAYLNFRNNLSMLTKNLPTGRLVPILFARLWLDFISLLKFLAEGKWGHVRAINKAHMYFFAKLLHNYRKRQSHIPKHVSGIFDISIVWQYFVKKRKYLRDLKM